MNQPGTAPVLPIRIVVAALAACAFLTVTLAGCGGPGTFVSGTPPPDVSADAWYKSPVPVVRAAIRQAMLDARIAVDPAANDDAVVGTKQQVPYVGKGTGEPAPWPLPVYRFSATATRQGDTHVRISVDVVCQTCNEKVPYEWEYPVDLLRDVFDGARRILSEEPTRISYPPRYRPVRWRPARRH